VESLGWLNGFRRRWIYRLRELTGNELWLLTGDKRSPYDPDFDFEKFSGALGAVCSAGRR
jgi:hypothetical protein